MGDAVDEILNKRRRDDFERKARRGELDPRLEYTFQFLIGSTGLPRNDIMDFVFNGNMLDPINELFMSNKRRRLMWFYQEVPEEEVEEPPEDEMEEEEAGVQAVPSTVEPVPSTSAAPQPGVEDAAGSDPPEEEKSKKQLFLTDGRDVCLTGLCLYMFRISTVKQLPSEEGFHKDLYCGVLNAEKIGIVTSVERVMEYVFMRALAYPPTNVEDDDGAYPIIKSQLLPVLRSFCSALRVCEVGCQDENGLEIDELVLSNLDGDQLREAAFTPQIIRRLEKRVMRWSKQVSDLLLESDQLRHEFNTSGPQDELEYWKKRAAQFTQLCKQLQHSEIQRSLLCLHVSRSRAFKFWKNSIDKKITICYNEAKDNAKYIEAMEKCVHTLYLDEPNKMQESILGMIQTVRLIYNVSQFYNTSERISSLMIKITNQMIDTCRQYITSTGKYTIWNQNQDEIIEKMFQCINLNDVYRRTYYTVRSQPFIPGAKPLYFSENYVFGKFDQFSNRLSKIIATYKFIDDYTQLFGRRVSGLMLWENLEDAMEFFENTKKFIQTKQYDYLYQRNFQFDKDFTTFRKRINELKDQVCTAVEQNYILVWNTPQGLSFLPRFERVKAKVPSIDMDDKYDRVLRYCDYQTERVLQVFQRQRDNPPVARNFTLIANRIRWSRTLHLHLKEFMDGIKAHSVLSTKPVTSDMLKRYDAVTDQLKSYENEMLAIWMDQNISQADIWLTQPLLKLDKEAGCIRVNYCLGISLLIREADCLAKLDLPLPVVASTLLTKRAHFDRINDNLHHMIDRFLTVVKSVKLEVRSLFLPHLLRLSSMLTPGFQSLNWAGKKWEPFVQKIFAAINQFEILTIRVHDIYSNRILEVLASMQTVTIHALPEIGEQWTIEQFMEKSELVSHASATILHNKSFLIEDAVEEILYLVKDATKYFQTDEPSEIDSLLQEDTSNSDTIDSENLDWTQVDECFEKPHILVPGGTGPPKATRDLVQCAPNEMRRFYTRKVIDVIIKVTKHSLEIIRKKFLTPELVRKEEENAGGGENEKASLADLVLRIKKKELNLFNEPLFIVQAILDIPNICLKPKLDEVQEALVIGANHITGVARGVGQWTGPRQVKQASRKVSTVYHRQSIFSVVNQQLGHEKEVREFRKKFYRMVDDRRPEFPIQQRNFYTQIMENKEVSKSVALIATCTDNIKKEVDDYMKRFKPFTFLWRNEKSKREMLAASLADFDRWLRRHSELEERLENESLTKSFYNSLKISIEQLKSTLLIEIRKSTLRIGLVMKKKYHREMNYLYAVMTELERNLLRQPKDLDETRLVLLAIGKIRQQEVDMELRIDPIEEAFAILIKHEIEIEPELLEQINSLRPSWHELAEKSISFHFRLLLDQPDLQQELKENMEVFVVDKDKFCFDYETTGPMIPGLEPREASNRLKLFQNRFDVLWRTMNTYQRGEDLFGVKITEYPDLQEIRKELNLLQKLYQLYNDVIDSTNSYYEISWCEISIEKINDELMDFQTRCRKLPKALKEWPAFFALKKTVDDFNDMCPLLELMSNKAMKPRHWDRIMDVCKREFDLENPEFRLKHLLEAPLFTPKNKEAIEDICIGAQKEKDIEGKLRQVTLEWNNQELQFLNFNNRGELLLRGDTTADSISLLDDCLMILSALVSNRYNPPFIKQINYWVYALSNTNEILERWLLVQNMWVYLEAVFVGGDISKQLPDEAKRFAKIDKAWQKIMQKAHDTSNVISCCVGDESLKTLLPHLYGQLELCQKSLSGYLEMKRTTFPRFFFVSDPALLEILGQASDPHTIDNHLLSMFDNMRRVKFHEKEYNKMIAFMSSEGETIPLERSVRAEGSVESWLMALLVAAQASLHAIIRTAYTMIQDPGFNLLTFLEKMPAQVGLLGIQMIWTRDGESALSKARNDPEIMGDNNNKCLKMLNTLIDQTTRDLTKIERTQFETLITIHVHQRDIFDILCRMNIRSANDFEWLKQGRFYFKEDIDKTWICITDVTFVYQNEYLGVTDRLVITPLTDRCYITLAQALDMSMGGAPCGPAGTGKTETVKDMGKTLAKYVVVFNCSDQMDYRGLGRIYKGLAQSGAWGCFDEFNRIELPVLSVAAQQVAVVLAAKKDKRSKFQFTDGDVISMSLEFGIFITMNPGYAGRKELPENLKIQFRIVAMMVPDRQLIIRVKMASCGFLENITLARKFFTLYKLCEEQLTKQVHYDFGLRNILSVLRSLGATKRVNVKDSESVIVMRVLRDMNLSKLIDEDEPLFMSMIADLFPNQTVDKTAYPQLEETVHEETDLAGIIYHPPWILKIIQLYEAQCVRHGIMTLGPSGAGKTTCIQILMRSLTKIEEYHREMRMNPKAITAAQMFGRLDVATNDWNDGIFSSLWRKTMKLRKDEHVWLVLDGPVDSIWIENLNSVLDDNKTLTLANGDRLLMAPTVKIIFEPENIDNASPATVSRNGMVYMSSSGLDWEPVIEAWLKTRSQTEIILLPSTTKLQKEYLKEQAAENPGEAVPPTEIQFESDVFRILFGRSFAKLYAFTLETLTMAINVLQCNVTMQSTNIIDGVIALHLIPPVDEAPVSNSPRDLDDDVEEEEEETTRVLTSEHLHRIYMFAITWSMGALLETSDRFKFDQFLRENLPFLDIPPAQLEDDPQPKTVFDYFVNYNGEWEPWSTLVPVYTYPEVGTPEFSTILVPITDNIRIDYLMNIASCEPVSRRVLLVGEQGSAKTVMMKSFMKKQNAEIFLHRSFSFSSSTSPYQFQKIIEGFVEKRIGMTFGPPNGKKMIIFIDDINLPEINEWGDQITNELVRQTVDMKGFYNLEKPGDFTTIVDIQFMAAMCQPGGARNDIPQRLKRQFTIFNCPLPSIQTMDKVFGLIAEGYYNAKRGFKPVVRDLVKKMIVVTRLMWQQTRTNLLPTPAKFHYVFSLRDLSRLWQGLVGTLSNVIDSEECLLLLWKHECMRVFADRFTTVADRDWYVDNLSTLIETELGPSYKAFITKRDPVFVDFMRDAPEPTGEEGEAGDDAELPKVYEPVDDLEVLRERLDMFLEAFNDMVRGAGMDLVFFPDAMLHITRISRVIGQPRGNMMLVGVGGSGKQSLTKLAAFIAGYKPFQIALTRSYNISNFLEDLKILYRLCGASCKGTAFIFTDLDVKEEGFLEYLNNVLSGGVISNLFNRDEVQEITDELIPVMRRENPKRVFNTETIMDYFQNKTCINLHACFCFSPVGEKFRKRALRFPSLISGCTLDWFQPWPREALVACARHFLSSFNIECEPEVKVELVEALGTMQYTVIDISAEYFQRFRRVTSVTFKSYLNFVNGYKKMYQMKQNELGSGAGTMDTGLKKLAEASLSIELMKKELAVTEAELDAATKKAAAVLSNVTERAKEAEIVKNQVKNKKEKAEILVATIGKEKALAEQKLESARPALEEAEDALNTIKPAHIATVRKLGRPPHLIMRIMDCVLILFKYKLHPTIADATCSSPKPSWAESLKFMSSTTFLLQFQNYPKDAINSEMVDLLQPYFDMEDYNMETAKRVCGDVAGLLSWTKAMAFFYNINKDVLPLKANLVLQEARLQLAMDDLAAAEQELEDRENALLEVKQQHEQAVAAKQRLVDSVNECLGVMNAATALINGLGGEKDRWIEQSREFKLKLTVLVGDVLLASGFLSYCGPYNQQYRLSLVDTWIKLMNKHSIPYTPNLNIIGMLVEDAELAEWELQGLALDESSLQNALVVTKSNSYPLLIDPQSQGKTWIKKKEMNNRLQVSTLEHRMFRTYLEDCLGNGRPLLIEDIDIEIDPVLDNVLEKNFIKSGTIEKVMIGDKECDVMPGFMLYITTKLPNPVYSPEISAKTSIIDFAVTMCGLEDQLLGRIISMEKCDLEEERFSLFECVIALQLKMKELQTSLLDRLNSIEGPLVEDETLKNILQTTKDTSRELDYKLEISAITDRKIRTAQAEFRAVAARGSMLYFLIVEMSNVNVMYQNSLKQFLQLFDSSITKSEKSPDTEERINIILKYLTREVWRYVSRGQYERHKSLFTLMLAMKIDIQRGKITHNEFLVFIKGGASLDLNAVQPKPFKWILDITWLNLVEISKLTIFKDILRKIENYEKDWRAWYEQEKPEECTIPCGYNSKLDLFRRLLLVRSWSQDRTLSQARHYIMDSLGPEYGDSNILDLEATWLESDSQTPLICILSIGSDPSPQITSLAKTKGMPLSAISMGQGQEVYARQFIDNGFANGGWVLLQNVHLSVPFCTEVLAILGEADFTKVHETFRLWITTEVHDQFPINLLQMSIKFTNEPPQGIRASLRRTYQNFDQETLDASVQPQWPPMLYSCAFLHTILQERRKFGPLGWNIPYEFNQSDFAASMLFVLHHLNEMDVKKGINWPTVSYMLGEVQYGGRVTDDFDKRLLVTFTQVWFCNVLLRQGFEFYKGYKVPNLKSLELYMEYINSLPSSDSPEIFGLHANADITYQINTAKGILDTILSVQPKEGGGGGGTAKSKDGEDAEEEEEEEVPVVVETREEVVYKLAEDMLQKLPKQYNSYEVKNALQRMGAFLPMNIFLRQEIDRFMRVITEVSTTLSQLKLAIDGTIVMSQTLRESLDAMFDARVPLRWQKVSWESATLGFWYTELLERDAQFRTWCQNGQPTAFWMTGFFNPQGFLTAMRQEVTRSHKGWALDTVIMQNEITRQIKENITEPPKEGVYVYGLFLEGAGFDRRSRKLIESKPKVLYEPMPVIYIYAINSTSAAKDPNLYECPVYRKPQRTDLKYVGSIDIETDHHPKHWTLRGVAVLCDIK